jgi:CubicO group peptidase (beta-lactamase class C family)
VGPVRESVWRRGMARAAAVGLVVALVLSADPLGSARPVRAADDPAATVIAKYQARIPELMAEQGIPGLAVALVDKDTVLWTEGFGHLDRDGSPPVTADTIFAVQSMSKNFTATAVMQAVGAGRLDLDQPITTYLPDFTVHSAFEEHPERKITLRMLLSHTAGFTMEAPLGNNYEFEPGEFDEHVRTISDTWLRFPVGTGYAYSNLGIDLAGFILERTYGAPFPEVLHDLLLGPLGMDRSTFDRDSIVAATNRAVGHTAPVPARDLPVFDAMTAAGGLYSTAADLARYLRFQLNDGSLDGRTVLDSTLMEEMRTVPAPHAGAQAGYALGMERYRWHASANADLFSHGGGGQGWLSDLWWSPPLGIGVAVLTNSADHRLQVELALSILGDLAHEPGSVYLDRLLALPSRPAADSEDAYQLPADLAELVAGAGMAPLGDESVRWARYVGIYRTPDMGLLDPTRSPQRFLVEGGVPYLDADDPNDYQVLVRHRLTEIEPGLFLSDDGETLDLRGPAPTWRNVDLITVAGGPAPWQWALLAASAVVSVWWLIAALVSMIRRRRGRPEPAEGVATGLPRWRLLVGAAATLTSILALGTIALLVALPGLVDSGFLGWLEVPVALRLVFHLPLALAVAAGCLVVLTAIGWSWGWRTRAAQLRYAALVVASVALTAQLAAWHLIGWGMT